VRKGNGFKFTSIRHLTTTLNQRLTFSSKHGVNDKRMFHFKHSFIIYASSTTCGLWNLLSPEAASTIVVDAGLSHNKAKFLLLRIFLVLHIFARLWKANPSLVSYKS